MYLLCICIIFLFLFECNNSTSFTKVRIKPINRLKSPFSFDFYIFTSHCLSGKMVLLWLLALMLLMDAY